MTQTIFAPGSVIAVRHRLWRVDGQPEDDVLVASTIDGGESRQVTFYVPFEAIEPGWPRPPFTWDEARRAQLRADLDGLYAHLYGLTREELAYILETFPIVKRKDEAQYGEYRTKRLVLEAYEATKKQFQAF